MYVEFFELESMNCSCFWGDKSDALPLGKKQHGLAKIGNLGNMKLQTRKCKLHFAVSHEKPDAKGLY